MQNDFISRPNPLAYGGSLRTKRRGRKARPLSFKHPIHLVLKANKKSIHSGLRSYKKFQLIIQLLGKYSRHFSVRIEQFTIQNDHIHLIVRASNRSDYKNFFRVWSGQIAQKFQNLGLIRRVTDTSGVAKEWMKLWLHRPFTRIVAGRRARRIVRDYIQLNEKEARGEIPYRKERLRGLTPEERDSLWILRDSRVTDTLANRKPQSVTDTPGYWNTSYRVQKNRCRTIRHNQKARQCTQNETPEIEVGFSSRLFRGIPFAQLEPQGDL